MENKGGSSTGSCTTIVPRFGISDLFLQFVVTESRARPVVIVVMLMRALNSLGGRVACAMSVCETWRKATGDHHRRSYKHSRFLHPARHTSPIPTRGTFSNNSIASVRARPAFFRTLHGLDFRKLQSGPTMFNFGSFFYALVGSVIWAFALGAFLGTRSGRAAGRNLGATPGHRCVALNFTSWIAQAALHRADAAARAPALSEDLEHRDVFWGPWRSLPESNRPLHRERVAS